MAVRLMDIKHARFLLSVATSYLLSLCALLASRYAGLTVAGFLSAVVVIGLILGCIEWIQSRDTRLPLRDFLARARSLRSIGWSGVLRKGWLIPVVFTCLLTIYLVRLGPYAEVPADAWWHFGEIQNVQSTLKEGNFPAEHSLSSLVRLNGTYWYYFPAAALYLSGQSLIEGLAALSALNTIVFIGMVYSFALFIFRNMASSRLLLHSAAAASVFFFIVHFGVNIFSFIRYYTFAPVFLNLGMYFATLVLVERLLAGQDVSAMRLILLLGLMAAMALIHRQELVYTVIMSFTMLLVAAWNANANTLKNWWSNGRWVLRDSYKRALGITALAALLTSIFLWVWFYVSRGRSNPLLNNRLVSVDSLFPFLKNLYILDPTYQFYQVVTAWGVLIFILYLVHKHWFQGNVYLAAAMLVPITTVFNPFFIDFFLRIYYVELVWRMCFMLPLPFIGGYILARYVASLWTETHWRRRVGTITGIIIIMVLLAPIDTRYFQQDYSRLETVRAVKYGNDYRQWQDLIQALNRMESKGIITDRVTGYVINGLTTHDYPGFKFYGKGAVPYNLPDYDADSFKGREDWLLVVNQRDGNYSRVGAISKHWSPRELQVSRHYSIELLRYVTSQPTLFTKVWEGDRIAVYRIKSGAIERS